MSGLIEKVSTRIRGTLLKDQFPQLPILSLVGRLDLLARVVGLAVLRRIGQFLRTIQRIPDVIGYVQVPGHPSSRLLKYNITTAVCSRVVRFRGDLAQCLQAFLPEYLNIQVQTAVSERSPHSLKGGLLSLDSTG